MKFTTAKLILGISLLAPAPLLSSSVDSIEVLDISKSPTQIEWQTFNKLSPAKQQQLWNYHSSKGKKLGNWSWEWRIGWVRSCLEPSKRKENYCEQIIKDGLEDDALVVRSETVKHLGLSYQGSKDLKIIQLLANTYKNARNYRNQKPLFIQRYILFSLKQIQGKQAHSIGEELAAKNIDTKKYWARISRF